MKRWLSWLTLASTLLLILTACADLEQDSSNGSATPDGMQAGQVVRVVDGDTIMVELDGQEERVRYIGIDTPESAIPNEPPECYGPEASDANAELVAGETVYLERDASDRDQYGRLLRYVFIDPDGDGELLFVNRELVLEGYADARRYEPDTSRAEQLAAAERQAKDADRGLWGACDQ